MQDSACLRARCSLINFCTDFWLTCLGPCLYFCLDYIMIVLLVCMLHSYCRKIIKIPLPMTSVFIVLFPLWTLAHWIDLLGLVLASLTCWCVWQQWIVNTKVNVTLFSGVGFVCTLLKDKDTLTQPGSWKKRLYPIYWIVYTEFCFWHICKDSRTLIMNFEWVKLKVHSSHRKSNLCVCVWWGLKVVGN